MLRAREEGWTRGTGSQIPFLPLSTTSPVTLDKFQGHRIFRQLLLPFGPRFTQAEPGMGKQDSGKPKPGQHLSSSPF